MWLKCRILTMLKIIAWRYNSNYNKMVSLQRVTSNHTIKGLLILPCCETFAQVHMSGQSNPQPMWDIYQL